MKFLNLVEDAEKLTYIGVGQMAGFRLVVKKDNGMLDVQQITPVALSGGHTWQTMKQYLEGFLS